MVMRRQNSVSAYTRGYGHLLVEMGPGRHYVRLISIKSSAMFCHYKRKFCFRTNGSMLETVAKRQFTAVQTAMMILLLVASALGSVKEIIQMHQQVLEFRFCGNYYVVRDVKMS